MMPEVTPDSTETRDLLEQVGAGDRQALGRLLALYRRRLHAFVAARLDAPLRARLDPSDLVQETQLRIAGRIHDYLEQPPMPFHLWARKLAYDRLLHARRDHRGAARRSVDREAGWPERSSLLLARPLIATGPSPSQQLAAREFAERVSRAVAELSESDREILLMRHAEDLPYEEIGCLLEIEPASARKRYGRALLRLRQVLSDHGLFESHP
jgi:RNA polymerase sigma-70 factor (ECF subfamily)